MIVTNAIANNPVNNEDIKLAQQIFGEDIGSLKGKTTRRKPLLVAQDYINIPSELSLKPKDVILCINGIKVNGITFLTTVSRNFCYRTAQFVIDKSVSSYRAALHKVFKMYNKAGFHVKEIQCDNKFRPLQSILQEVYKIHINFANPQEHAPEAKQNNQVIKERVRATYHQLPYSQLTSTMTKMLVTESTKKLNFFPSKGGISEYYSPRMILHQKTLDYKKNCKYSFGSYVQAHDEPNPLNTTAARTLDGIYL
jgi:hypothetical protein